jgi:hypothetical protein
LFDVPGDEADVVDPAPAELLDDDPHADRNTMTAINVPVVTTGCLRMRVTSVFVKIGRTLQRNFRSTADCRNTVPRGRAESLCW